MSIPLVDRVALIEPEPSEATYANSLDSEYSFADGWDKASPKTSRKKKKNVIKNEQAPKKEKPNYD